MHEPIVKGCGCGCNFTRAAWGRLVLVGYTELAEDEEGPGGVYEMRNCPLCNSTISIVVQSTEVDPSVPYTRLEEGPTSTADPTPSADPADRPEAPTPGRSIAAGGADPASGDATPPTACETCQGALSEEQRRRGARHCSPACRGRASRERAKSRRLEAIDGAVRALLEVRGDVERG